MKLFNFKKREHIDYSAARDYAVLSHAELERKAQLGKPMTFEETEALRRFRQKDVTNQVLRLIGLLAILVVICFAVGCFLYPYSLINFLGKDAFWSCWGNIGVYLGQPFGENGWVKLSEIYNGIMTDEYGMVYAFGPHATPMMNFFAIGGWTIIPLATAGLIATVIFSLYILVYNIKDLVLVIKHVSHKTKDVVSDIANITKQEVSEVKESKPVQRKPRKKKEPKVEESEDKEISKRVQEIKEEIENNENDDAPAISTTKEVVVSSNDLSSLDDSDLDKLLK